MHLLFCARFINVFSFLRDVELRDIFSISNAKGMPSLCKLYLQQYSFLYIQTLHNDCSYIEDVHHLVCAHSINFFSFLRGVELRHFFHLKCLGGCLVCVICNSNSIHSFIFELCVMTVHTLKMCPFYFVKLLHFFSHF